MHDTRELYIGVDVQLSRGCPVVVLDAGGRQRDATWLEGDAEQIVVGLRRFVSAQARQATDARVTVGIDAPRQPMQTPRTHYWDGGAGRWRAARPADRGYGRHCEIVVAALGLGRPQWTPLEGHVPAWMSLGFACFRVLNDRPLRVRTFEVFPSASYRLLDASGPRIEIVLTGFARGPKDMLDACCCAATVREVVQGRGWAAGGGDGLGTIALPGRMPTPESPVHHWPGPTTDSP